LTAIGQGLRRVDPYLAPAPLWHHANMSPHRIDPRSGSRHSKQTRARVEDDASRLRQALAEIEALMPVLSALLPETGGQGPQTGVIGRHAPESSEPWQSEAATAYWTIHAGLRFMANSLRIERGLREQVWRGQDDATAHVIKRIRNLIPGASDDLIAESLRDVERWITAAKSIADIDETERWVPVPRARGAKPPKCPYCKTFSLRMARRRGEVRCFFPGCTDSDDRPTRARMEHGAATGDGMLVFGDDTTLHFRKDEEAS
jgi:hypothetical protein